MGVLALAACVLAALVPSGLIATLPASVSPIGDAKAAYTVYQCDASRGIGLDGWRAGSDGWAAQNQCAGGFNVTGLVNGVYTNAGSVAYWRTPNLPGNLSFQGVTYEGSGSLQSAFIGVARFCMDDVDPWCSSGGASWVINNAGWVGRSDAAPGAREFQLLLSCFGASPCPRQTWSNIWLRNVAFTMNDGDAPGIGWQGGTLSFVNGYANPTTWNHGSKTLIVRGWDGTSGTERDYVAFDHNVNHPLKQAQSAPGCNRVSGGYSTFVPCAALNDFTHTIDTTQFSDGGHALHAWTYDASGNPQQANLTFRVDNTKPAEPAALDVAGDNTEGWKSVNDFDVSWNNTGETVTTETQSGLKRGCYDVDPAEGQAVDPAPVCVDNATSNLSDVQVPEDGEWSAKVWTRDGAGNDSDKAQVALNLDTTVPGKPEGEANGWVGLPELLGGKYQWWTKPINWQSVNSEFCGYGLSVSQGATDEAPTTINVIGNVESGQIPPGTPEGNNWVHFRAISCAGLYGPSEHVELNVDLTKPQATVTGVPASGWTNAPGAVNVAGSDAMPGSGMDGAPDTDPLDHGAFVRFSLDGSTATEVRGAHTASYDASTIAEGAHTLEVRTHDYALNYDEQSFTYGVDKTAPGGAFTGADPADPTVFKVAATDALSGAVGGEVQYAPIGDAGDPSAYKPMATRFEAGQLVAVFPDTKLPHGRYALRAVVEDAATNTGLVTNRVDGSRMVIDNPLRDVSALALSATKNGKVCKRKKARTKAGKKKAAKKLRDCKKKLKSGKGTDVSVAVRYGRALMLYGTLKDQNGRPLEGQKIELYQQRAGDALRLVAGATTDAQGGFAYKAPGGPSRRIIAYWPGTKTKQDISASVRLGVATKVRLRVTPKRVRGSKTFTLKGRIYAQDGVATNGKLVQLQFYNFLRRKWQAGPALVRADATGKFSYRYRIKRATAAREKIRFRAFVPAESSWAYDAGTSNTQTIIHTR